jgi:hypothetical protein
VKLQGGKSDADPLSDSSHHHVFVVLHQKNLLEASLLHLVAGSHQLLLLCWQQEGRKVRDDEQ